ncbi:MAG TPA: hypothetical protein DCE10_09415 [Acidimicrobiaceae bacterium]|nr:hypothetical protein [Acidimicrobiaceae bacterium]
MAGGSPSSPVKAITVTTEEQRRVTSGVEGFAAISKPQILRHCQSQTLLLMPPSELASEIAGALHLNRNVEYWPWIYLQELMA